MPEGGGVVLKNTEGCSGSLLVVLDVRDEACATTRELHRCERRNVRRAALKQRLVGLVDAAVVAKTKKYI